MKQNKKIELISKNFIKKSILKYSNLTLFERREKEYNTDKKIIKKIPKSFKISKSLHKRIDETKENILQPFYQTMSSFHYSDKSSTILPLLDYFETDSRNIQSYRYKINHNKLNPNNKTEKTNIQNNLNKINNFFLTESAINKTRNNRLNNLSILQKKDNDSKRNDSNADTLLFIQTCKNNENFNNKLKISGYLSDRKTNLKHYSYIKQKSKEDKNIFEKLAEKLKAKKMIDNKLSKYTYYNEPRLKDYIKKTQEYKIHSYTAKVKKERAIRLEEEYYNQIQFYQDTMGSLESARKLLDIQFSNKIADYTRFLISKREREIVKSSKLIQKIINHKKDIEHIKAKIAKIDIEKGNIIKWIFFMIQLKEKKLVLPNHYKTIFERDKQRRISRRQVTKKESKSEYNRSKNRKITSRRIGFSRADSLFNKESKEIDFDNKENKDNKETNKENKDDKENKENTDNKDNKDNNKDNKKEDYEKIINYKNNLIFQTTEEFQDRLSGLENENLILLNYNNKINRNVLQLKRELNFLIKDKEKNDSRNNKILLKEKELENIKNIIREKTKIIKDFKKSQEILENAYRKEREKGKNKKSDNIIENNINIINIENNNVNENKNTLLYRKINDIFEESKIVGCTLSFHEELLCLINKKIYSKEKEMIFMLEYIEQTIDYLMMKIKNYMTKNDNTSDFIKSVKLDIERGHKIDKARIQMMLGLQKIQILKEKVEKRSNKIYFLPTKKIDLSTFRNKKKKIKIDKDLNKMPTIEDYLYNENNTCNK